MLSIAWDFWESNVWIVYSFDVECTSLDEITFYQETLHSIRIIQVDEGSFDLDDWGIDSAEKFVSDLKARNRYVTIDYIFWIVCWISQNLSVEMSSDIGIYGLTSQGIQLALNFASKGYLVTVGNKSSDKVRSDFCRF